MPFFPTFLCHISQCVVAEPPIQDENSSLRASISISFKPEAKWDYYTFIRTWDAGHNAGLISRFCSSVLCAYRRTKIGTLGVPPRVLAGRGTLRWKSGQSRKNGTGGNPKSNKTHSTGCDYSDVYTVVHVRRCVYTVVQYDVQYVVLYDGQYDVHLVMWGRVLWGCVGSDVGLIITWSDQNGIK